MAEQPLFETFDDFVADVLKEVKPGNLEVHGWKLELTIPNGDIRDLALKQASGKDGNQFFYVYRRWIAAGCITAITTPDGKRTQLPLLGTMPIPSKNEKGEVTQSLIGISEYLAKLIGIIPYQILDAIYREVNKLKDEYTKVAKLPTDDGVMNLHSTLEKVLGITTEAASGSLKSSEQLDSTETDSEESGKG